jgi:hypothetical protein
MHSKTITNHRFSFKNDIDGKTGETPSVLKLVFLEILDEFFTILGLFETIKSTWDLYTMHDT